MIKLKTFYRNLSKDNWKPWRYYYFYTENILYYFDSQIKRVDRSDRGNRSLLEDKEFKEWELNEYGKQRVLSLIFEYHK